ncbi:Holo-[acyl-carrier-protein] synthase [Buchnera aphidicola (Thelaxes suberi)]|uniref:holo-ACP synthase n=1 Tax=Buchnera aphidicola TaxID=9 RepID=UPI003463D8FE
MTIIGIGIDIIEIKRMKKLFLIHKEKIAKKILSKNEWKRYLHHSSPINFLCKSFNGKEAASKALGTGIRNNIHWKDFEINNDKLGKPHLQFYGETKKKIKDMNVKKTHISFSHEKKYIISMVILEK